MGAMRRMGTAVVWLAARVATLVALGCGGQAQSDERRPLASGARAEAPEREPPAPLPMRAPSAAPPVAGEAAGSRAPRMQRPPAMATGDQGTPAKESAANVLIANCGDCHGPTAPLAGSGGIRFID